MRPTAPPPGPASVCWHCSCSICSSSCWVGEPGLDLADVDQWLRDGARLVGGCCRIGPDDIAAVAASVHAPR